MGRGAVWAEIPGGFHARDRSAAATLRLPAPARAQRPRPSRQGYPRHPGLRRGGQRGNLLASGPLPQSPLTLPDTLLPNCGFSPPGVNSWGDFAALLAPVYTFIFPVGNSSFPTCIRSLFHLIRLGKAGLSSCAASVPEARSTGPGACSSETSWVSPGVGKRNRLCLRCESTQEAPGPGRRPGKGPATPGAPDKQLPGGPRPSSPPSPGQHCPQSRAVGRGGVGGEDP